MKPQLYLINTFDASREQEIRFSWEGNQSFENTCIIRDNQTEQIVYKDTQITMQLKHVLPANSLTNGKLYNVRVATIDVNDNISDYSSPILFYCFTSPVFEFVNISPNFVIRNAVYQVSMSYSQIEGEQLESYVIELFDESKNLLQSSGTKYEEEIKHTFTNLEDNQTYYIKATGRTLNGMDIETEYILVSVNYEQPQIYSIITLENVKENGLIKIQSNIRIVECHTTDPPIFIDDEYIDLRNNTLEIYEGFSLDSDYIVRCIGYNMSPGLIMTIGDVDLYFKKLEDNSFVELYVPFYDSKYFCYSNYLENLTDTEQVELIIVKKNGLYNLSLERIECFVD